MVRDIDRSWDQLVPLDNPDPEYGPTLDLLADAGEAAGLGEAYLTVEVVFPKTNFYVGDLIIQTGSREYDDVPDPGTGYWADCYDAVTTTPFNDPRVEADTPEALFAAYIPMLVEAGLVQVEDGKVVPTKWQRTLLDAAVKEEERRLGW